MSVGSAAIIMPTTVDEQWHRRRLDADLDALTSSVMIGNSSIAARSRAEAQRDLEASNFSPAIKNAEMDAIRSADPAKIDAGDKLVESQIGRSAVTLDSTPTSYNSDDLAALAGEPTAPGGDSSPDDDGGMAAALGGPPSQAGAPLPADFGGSPLPPGNPPPAPPSALPPSIGGAPGAYGGGPPQSQFATAA